MLSPTNFIPCFPWPEASRPPVSSCVVLPRVSGTIGVDLSCRLCPPEGDGDNGVDTCSGVDMIGGVRGENCGASGVFVTGEEKPDRLKLVSISISSSEVKLKDSAGGATNCEGLVSVCMMKYMG